MTVPAATPTGWTPMPGAHWLHPQKSSRVPRRYVFFDTEARRTRTDLGETQTWRLGVSAAVRWREQTGCWSPITPTRHHTPEQLWETICGFARKDFRTVVVAHNLGYDLRISRALELLPAWGWEIRRPTFSSETVSLEVRSGDRSLVLVDSVSLIPHRLSTIAGWVDGTKPALPDDDDPDSDWWARCEADVTILARAYLSVMDRLARSDLGGWARTGAGIGWHVLLRRHLDTKVLVHADPQTRTIESDACYANRCEVWRWGRQRGGPFHEWDFTTAYANICATTPLPAVLIGRTTGLTMDTLRQAPTTVRYLVHAEVEADVPVLPWRDDHGVVWPAGRFDGWWWDVEVAAAEAAGVKVRPGVALRYRASPWLAGFARWCLDEMADLGGDHPKVWAAVTKQWTRSVIGRTAMQYQAWDNCGEAWVEGASFMSLLDVDTEARGAALMLGGRRWESWRRDWWDQALPQVLSAVMASARVQLWQAMLAAGLEHVVYVDTDCLVVDRAGHQALLEATSAGGLPGLRVKSVHRSLSPVAPQMIDSTSYRRRSGVPRSAVEVEPGVWQGEVWDRLTGTLVSGHVDEVRVRTRTWRPRLVDWRRVHLPGGATAAYRVEGSCRVDQREEAS